MHHEFAQGSQDQEGEEPAEGVDEDECGAGLLEASARAHEQARADRSADRDHLDLSRAERFPVAEVFLDEDVAPEVSSFSIVTRPPPRQRRRLSAVANRTLSGWRDARG